MMTRVHLIKVISGLIDRPLNDQNSSLPWAELGIDSVTATELLIQLEEVLHAIDAREIEAALYHSSSPAELAARLAEQGRPQ